MNQSSSENGDNRLTLLGEVEQVSQGRIQIDESIIRVLGPNAVCDLENLLNVFDWLGVASLTINSLDYRSSGIGSINSDGSTTKSSINLGVKSSSSSTREPWYQVGLRFKSGVVYDLNANLEPETLFKNGEDLSIRLKNFEAFLKGVVNVEALNANIFTSPYKGVSAPISVTLGLILYGTCFYSILTDRVLTIELLEPLSFGLDEPQSALLSYALLIFTETISRSTRPNLFLPTLWPILPTLIGLYKLNSRKYFLQSEG